MEQDWICAQDSLQFAIEQGAPNAISAKREIAFYCRSGHIIARSKIMSVKIEDAAPSEGSLEQDTEIPHWFWNDFVDPDCMTLDWESGYFTGQGELDQKFAFVKLWGVEFEKLGLNILKGKFRSNIKDKTPKNLGGAPGLKFWDELWSDIAVQLYFGDLQPKTMSDIEKAMFAWLAEREEEASEQSIRRRARPLWYAIERRQLAEDQNR